MRTELIVGPPGTGKTTYLLEVVDGALNSGIQPSDICFVAFTRKAANEARNRALEKFNLQPEELPWFRTLHSMAYRCMSLGRGQLMDRGDYINIARALSMSITFKTIGEDGTITALTRGDRLFFMETMARSRCVSLREMWESLPDEDIYWHELERLQKTILKYKEERGKRDFTDIISDFTSSDHCPDFQVAVVDEAQDLSKLQWGMAKKIIGNSGRSWVAGDDDQAIFRWAGADVDSFINFDAERIVLPKSYRVPSRVQHTANAIISQVSERIPKVWEARQENGEVVHVSGIEDIDMRQGTWLLLARNTYLLDPFIHHCMREGLLFEALAGGSPIEASTIRAIKSWETLRKGEKITGIMAKEIYDLMGARTRITHGYKKKILTVNDRETLSMVDLHVDYGLMQEVVDMIWHVALDKIPPVQAEYFIAALKGGEKMLHEPRIKISTIHGVKGGEAENVVICTDMAIRTFNEYQGNPDDEHRVWYVAVTRAKQRLYIMQPQTIRSYQI